MKRTIFLIGVLVTLVLNLSAAMSPEEVSNDVISSMSSTNSNWSAIDLAIQKVIAHGDAAVPFLAIYTRSDEYLDYNDRWGFRKARALYMLAAIGSHKAEDELMRVIGDLDNPDEIVVTSLAIINKQKVVDTLLVDRSWYQHRYNNGEKLALLWWRKTGQNQYRAKLEIRASKQAEGAKP